MISINKKLIIIWLNLFANTDDGGTFDFFEIKLVEGAVRLRYNLGGGANIITVGRELHDGHWHKVQVRIGFLLLLLLPFLCSTSILSFSMAKKQSEKQWHRIKLFRIWMLPCIHEQVNYIPSSIPLNTAHYIEHSTQSFFPFSFFSMFWDGETYSIVFLIHSSALIKSNQILNETTHFSENDFSLVVLFNLNVYDSQ